MTSLKANAVNQGLLEQFLSQCCGKWHSDRRYFYLQRPGQPVEQTIVELDIHHGQEHEYEVDWTNDSGSFSLGFNVEGMQFLRSRGYATQSPTVSDVIAIDNNRLRTRTKYNSTIGSEFIETIRFLSDDVRSRQTISYQSGEIFLIGQYVETRLP